MEFKIWVWSSSNSVVDGDSDVEEVSETKQNKRHDLIKSNTEYLFAKAICNKLIDLRCD